MTQVRRMINIEEESSFGIMDYVVFCGMLCVSTGIGCFYAWKGRKNVSSKDFLTANRSLGVFPVAMSLLASFQSSVTILGYPAEMFYRGTQFWVVILSGAVASIAAAELFLPVYYKLRFTSVNQYLSARFGSETVRLAASFSFLLATVPYMGVVLYGPSLALGSVTPLSVEASILLIGFICTFYTSIGGIKAVVWTDVVQVILMFAGLWAVMIRGFSLVGGVGEAFRIASENGRVQFLNVDWDPYSTSNLWNAIFGMGIMWCGNYCTSQTEVQRYCNVRSQAKARIALYANMIGMVFLISSACLCGVALYAYYSTCDPLRLGVIHKTDQLMPYFVMDQMRHIPGMAGLFVACVFSASLSTMSSGFNALATVTWDDFLTKIPAVGRLSDKANKRLGKVIALTYGCSAIGLAFLVAKLDSVLQAAISIAGSLVGPTLGLYLLGMLCPFANATGVLIGLVCGEAFGLWALIGSVMFARGPPSLATSVDECPANLMTAYYRNSSSTLVGSSPGQDIHIGLEKIYHMAYLLVPVSGFLISVMVGLLASILTGGCKAIAELNTDLMSPLIFKLWPSQCLPVRKLPSKIDEPSFVSMNGGVSTVSNGVHAESNGHGRQSRSGSMKMTILSLKQAVVDHTPGLGYTGLPTSENGGIAASSHHDLLAQTSSSGSRSSEAGSRSSSSSNSNVASQSNSTTGSPARDTTRVALNPSSPNGVHLNGKDLNSNNSKL